MNRISQLNLRKLLFLLGTFFLIALVGYSFYIFNLEQFTDKQNTLVFGQNRFSPGSAASFRVVTLDFGTQTPIPNADINITLQSKSRGPNPKALLFTGKTNSSGTADIRFPVPELAEGDYELTIDTHSPIGKDTFSKTVEIKRSYKILLTTDKPLYQPGQTIHIRALALSTLDALPAANREVTIEVEDAKGNKVFKKKPVASPHGVVGQDFTLAHELNAGLFTVRAKIGEDFTEKKVTVKPYVLPKFKIDFSTDKAYYLPGQLLKGVTGVDYFFGKPVRGADINIKVYTYEIDMEPIAAITGKTDARGNFTFEYTLPGSFIGLPLEKGSALLFFDISVIDQANHKENVTRSVPISKDPIQILLIPESGSLVREIENLIYIMTTYPDGRPAQTTVTIDNQKLSTNSWGIAEMRYTPQDYNITLNVSAEDSRGNTGIHTETFSIGYQAEYILVRTGQSVYEAGDSAQVDIFCNREKGTVYVDVIKDQQTLLTRALELENRRAALTLDLDETMTGALEIHAYKIFADSTLVRDGKTIFVKTKKDIDLAIRTDKPSYLPGAGAAIKFSTQKNGQPIPAAIGVNIVDESVFALEEKEAGIESLYFALEKELLEPKYAIYGITLPSVLEENTRLDPQVKTRAENLLFAQAPTPDRFMLKSSSWVEKERRQEEKRAGYFRHLGSFVYGLILLIPFIIAGVTVYSYKGRVKTLLQEFGLSILLFIGILAVGFGIMSIHIYFERGGLAVIMDVALVLVTGVLLFWSGGKKYIKVFVVSCILMPMGLLYLMAVLTDRHEVFLWILAGVFLMALIGSFIVLLRHTRENKESFAWNCILYSIYVGLIVLFILLTVIGKYEREMSTAGKVVWIGYTSFLVIAAFLVYALRAIKNRQRAAGAAAYLALIAIIPLLATFSISRMEHGMPGVAGNDVMLGAPIEDREGFDGRRTAAGIGVDERLKEVRIGGTPRQEKPVVREFFPETLYSNPLVITDETGNATVDLKVADSITTWRITALASSLKGDIGTGTQGLRVFRDFFIDIDLPLGLTQNDEVSIPIAVYNYLPRQQTLRLELVQETWFESMDKKEKTLTLDSNDVGVVYYRIKAREIGNQKLTVYANGTQMSDAISRAIEIIPDGYETRTSVSDRLSGEITKTILIPGSAVENSEKLFVKIYPGIFSQLVEGLDSMFSMPYGCFEQTSSTTYPNVLLLEYMKNTQQITPEIRLKAEEYIGIGYQRLVSFESVTLGGWTWFGAPEEANLMLSAYGLMEFHDMNKVYEIDPAIIPRTQHYLLTRVKSDGSFEPEGNLHTGGLERSQSSKMSSTAFVAWSLLHTGSKDLDKTMDFIKNNLELKKEDSYVLALSANALVLYDKTGGFTRAVLEELDERAIKEDKVMYWKTPVEYQNSRYRTAVSGGTGDMKGLETTALAAIAYIHADYRPTAVNKILTHIVNQKDSFGNWGSTFATILSLKALIDSVAQTGEGTDADIRIDVNNEEAARLKVTAENDDVLQQVDLKKYVKKGNNLVKITMSGTGNLFYQVVGSYYSKWAGKEGQKGEKEKKLISIDLGYDKTKLYTGDVVTVDVNARYNGEGYANFVVIDLGIPPGFDVLTEDLAGLKEKKLIEKYEIAGRQIILYVRNLGRQGIGFVYRLKPKYPLKAKTTKSVVYDYYNPRVKDEVEPLEMEVLNR